MTSLPVWGLSGAVKSYGGRVVLDIPDVSLHPGVSMLLGRNGAGKTTLIRCLVGATPLSSGDVVVDGVVVAGESWRALRSRVGWLPQDFSAPSTARLSDVVGYAAWLKGLSGAEIATTADRVLATVGLIDRRQDRVSSLSGGMVRRLGIACALVASPQLVLLDEPTAGLDPEQRESLQVLVRRIAAEAAVLWSTHLLEDVVAMNGTVVILDQGRVRFSGTKEQLTATVPGAAEIGRLQEAFRGVVARDGD